MMKKSSTSHSDTELIDASISGDRSAFAELVRRYQGAIYKFSYTVCRNRSQAEETTQDTMINMYRSLGSFDRRSQLGTWLYRIVINNCFMNRRKTKQEKLLQSYDDPAVDSEGKHRDHIPRWDETPADILTRKEFRELLDKAILGLAMDYRLVFILRDVEGRSTAETARLLNISEEATKSRLRRARAFLRDQLNPYFMDHRRPKK